MGLKMPKQNVFLKVKLHHFSICGYYMDQEKSCIPSSFGQMVFFTSFLNIPEQATIKSNQ